MAPFVPAEGAEDLLGKEFIGARLGEACAGKGLGPGTVTQIVGRNGA